MDKKIFDLIEAERKRQNEGLELIPSENAVSKEVLDAMGSVLTNKYSEGYPNFDGLDGASRDPLSIFSFHDLMRSTAISSGLGARLDFGLVLVRFDLGLRVHDPSVQQWMGINDWFNGNYAFHFGIGYPF